MTTGDGSAVRGAQGDAVERYLDGLLSGEDLASFERALARDEVLRGEVALQRRIDGSLGRVFAPPAGVGSGRAEASSAVAGRIGLSGGRGSRRRLLALAAGLGVLVAGGAAGWLMLRPDCERANPLAPVTGGAYYRSLVQCGFEPDWKCGSDEEFREATAQRVGSAFTVASAPGLEVVGWVYQSPGMVLARSSTTLLARADGRPVVVVMDRADRDFGVDLGESSGLHLHRAERDGVVLYELSPFGEPRVINRLRD